MSYNFFEYCFELLFFRLFIPNHYFPRYCFYDLLFFQGTILSCFYIFRLTFFSWGTLFLSYYFSKLLVFGFIIFSELLFPGFNILDALLLFFLIFRIKIWVTIFSELLIFRVTILPCYYFDRVTVVLSYYLF